MEYLKAQEVLDFLQKWASEGESAKALLAFTKGEKESRLFSDKGLSEKLTNVLTGATVKTLRGLCESGTVAALETFLNRLAKDGQADFSLVDNLPKSKILLSSDVYHWYTTGEASEGLQALAAVGKGVAAKKAATSEKAKATRAAKKEAEKAASNPHVSSMTLSIGIEDFLSLIPTLGIEDLAAIKAAIAKRESALMADSEQAA